MKYTKIVLTALQILISVALFYAISLKINFSSVLKCFQQADIKFLFCAFILLSVNQYFTIVFKYGKILETAGYKISVSIIRIVKLGAMPLAVILPFKTGKALRLAYLKNLGVPYFGGLISILLEFLFAIISLFLIFFFGVKTWAGVLFLFAVILVSKSFKNSFSAFFWSGIYEIVRIFYILLIFLSFGISLILKDIFIKVPVMLCIAGLPITVSGLGAREMSALFLFSDLPGKEKIFSAVITVSFLELLVPSVIGLLFMRKFLKGIAKFDGNCL